MPEEEIIGGRKAAEDYRAQRQEADARRNGFEAMTPEQFLAWSDENRPRLADIAQRNGAAAGDVEAAVEEYLALLKSVPAGAPFDDLNITLILAGIVQRIEGICAAGGIPVRDGVAYGVSPKLGLEASQMAVMRTGASIITVSQGFPIFCNMISKAVALSLMQDGDWASWDPSKVKQQLAERPGVRVFWTQILASYALEGWPPTGITPPQLDLPQQVTRLQVLQAMELFAVAHEYGHHVLEHGVAESSDEVRDHFADEHEADIFARLIGLKEGLDSDPPNLYSASGAAAVLMLGSLDLVRRATALLESGAPQPRPRRSHPPLDDRIAAIAGADDHAAEADRAVFDDLRLRARDLLEIVWTFVEPTIRGLHDNGFRPLPASPDVGGWLPGR